MTPEEIAQLRRAYEYEHPNVSQTPESYERGFQNWLARNNYQEQPQRREIKKGQYISPDELKFRQAVIDKYYIDNPQNRARYRTETRYNQDEGFQKKHPIANAWYNIFKPVAGPTGGAVPINTQLPEMDYQDPRVQYEGMQYQVPGPVTDGLNLPRELAYNPTMDNARLLLNMENERMQANRLRNNIGRDVNKLQVPGLPEWYRNIVRNDARAMEQRIRDLGEQQ